jgi:hypothetical protein
MARPLGPRVRYACQLRNLLAGHRQLDRLPPSCMMPLLVTSTINEESTTTLPVPPNRTCQTLPDSWNQSSSTPPGPRVVGRVPLVNVSLVLSTSLVATSMGLNSRKNKHEFERLVTWFIWLPGMYETGPRYQQCHAHPSLAAIGRHTLATPTTATR